MEPFIFKITNCESILNTTERCSISYHKFEDSVKHAFIFNNSATYGPVLYGGLFDRCFHKSARKPYLTLGIDYFKQISQYEHTVYAVTSDPVKVCICINSFEPDCATREVMAMKMRGETVNVSVTSVDQDSNPVPSVIRANYEKTTANLGEGEGRNRLNNCTTLLYHIFSVDSSAKLILQPEGVCERSPLSNLAINIEIVGCSRGFEQDKDRCVCDRRLTKYLNITICLIDNLSVERKATIWLSYEERVSEDDQQLSSRLLSSHI